MASADVLIAVCRNACNLVVTSKRDALITILAWAAAEPTILTANGTVPRRDVVFGELAAELSRSAAAARRSADRLDAFSARVMREGV
jgi:hypothetical protein